MKKKTGKQTRFWAGALSLALALSFALSGVVLASEVAAPARQGESGTPPGGPALPAGPEGTPSPAPGSEASSSPVASEQATGGSALPKSGPLPGAPAPEDGTVTEGGPRGRMAPLGDVAACSCTTPCTPANAETGAEAAIDAACPVCGAENADLSLCAAIAPLPALAPQAGNKAGLEMTGGLGPLKVNTSDASVIYYGSYNGAPQPWVVIGYEGQGVAGQAGTVTLLSQTSVKDGVPFSNNHHNYNGSNLQTEMNTAAGRLSATEQAAIRPRDLTACELNGDNHNRGHSAQADSYYCNGVKDYAAYDEKFWPLSSQEAVDTNGSLRALDGNRWWWLRSPGGNASWAAVVAAGVLNAYGASVSSERSLRPALQLNLSSVLFTSAASGASAKSSTTVGGGFIGAPPSGADLKLTLFDTARLTLAGTNPTSVNGRTVCFAYTGATAGKALSAIIKNGNGAVKFYGKLAADIQANGTASVTLPDGFAADDTLHIFTEEINGDKLTDYTSATNTIAIALQAAPAAPQGGVGQITGVDSSMEYKPASASGWTAITGSSVTGLAAGSYQVRYAGKVASGGAVAHATLENGGVATLASPAKTLTVTSTDHNSTSPGSSSTAPPSTSSTAPPSTSSTAPPSSSSSSSSSSVPLPPAQSTTPQSPQTGDTLALWPLLALAAVALLGGGTALVLRHKRAAKRQN